MESRIRFDQEYIAFDAVKETQDANLKRASYRLLRKVTSLPLYCSLLLCASAMMSAVAEESSIQQQKTPFDIYGKDRIEECKQKADAGDAVSQYLYARAVEWNMQPYQKAKGEAVKYAMSAVEKGYGAAYFILAYVWVYKGETNEWTCNAINWASENAKFGDPVAQWQLSKFFREGLGVEKNETMADALRDKAANKGELNARYDRAIALDEKSEKLWKQGAFVDAKDLAMKAVHEMKLSADSGNPFALSTLACWYLDGMAVRQKDEKGDYKKEYRIQRDKNKFFEYERKSAEQGNVWSYSTLADAYNRGEGCIKDKSAYIEWMCKAADAGDVVALYTVGEWFETGVHVKKDVPRAIEMIRGCANVNVAYDCEYYKERGNAAEKLSVWYETGFGTIDKDERISAEWLERAARIDIDGHIDKLIEKYPKKAVLVCQEYKGFGWPNGVYTRAKSDEWRRQKMAACLERQKQLDVITANRGPVLTEEQVTELKKTSNQHKTETFVFKGLCLGMDAALARRLIRYYLGSVSNEVADVDGKVNKIVLSRTQIDLLFKTQGVSTEAFCKSICSAYPIVTDFDTKVERIADYAARKKFMEDVKEDATSAAMSNVRLTNPGDALVQGLAAGVTVEEACEKARKQAENINKRTKCYFCESPKGFLLEIRPEEPDRFFTLQKISSLKKENFD